MKPSVSFNHDFKIMPESTSTQVTEVKLQTSTKCSTINNQTVNSENKGESKIEAAGMYIERDYSRN